MAREDIEALVTSAREQVDQAGAEISNLRGRLDSCEGDLEYLNAAVDQLLETVEELVIFVGEDRKVEGVSESVARLAETPEADLVGKPIAAVARAIGLDDVAAAVDSALADADFAETLRVPRWEITVKAVDDGRNGAIVVAHSV